MSKEEQAIQNLAYKKGIFGLGFSIINELDFMNLVILAGAGIMIKLFFQENYTKLGTMGPASTTIWGYGLTATSLFLMIFMSIYLNDNKIQILEEKSYDNFTYIKLLFNNTIPILLTFGLIVYIIILNFIYFTKINSNAVSDSFHLYSFFSSLLLILQISLIVKYIFNILEKLKSPNDKNNKQNSIIKGLSYILAIINFIFIFIKHILLAFFSTDG